MPQLLLLLEIDPTTIDLWVVLWKASNLASGFELHNFFFFKAFGRYWIGYIAFQRNGRFIKYIGYSKISLQATKKTYYI